MHTERLLIPQAHANIFFHFKSFRLRSIAINIQMQMYFSVDLLHTPYIWKTWTFMYIRLALEKHYHQKQLLLWKCTLLEMTKFSVKCLISRDLLKGMIVNRFNWRLLWAKRILSENVVMKISIAEKTASINYPFVAIKRDLSNLKYSKLNYNYKIN